MEHVNTNNIAFTNTNKNTIPQIIIYHIKILASEKVSGDMDVDGDGDTDADRDTR